jgi:cytoskeletal protein CcmA (bactofilin family)
MSISTKGHDMADKQEGLSIIDKDCLVEGTLDIKGKLVIAGSLKGNLIGNTVVTVKGSHVHAPAKVREMIIGGEFEGDITVYESLRILSTGAFSGKIVCKSITLETGGKLNGRVKPLDSAEGVSLADTALAAGDVSPALPQVEGDTEGKDPSLPIDN